MSLSVEARREARRRKILENSNKRLARILNQSDDTEEQVRISEVSESLTNSCLNSSATPSNNSTTPSNSSSQIEDYYFDNVPSVFKEENSLFSTDFMSNEQSKINEDKFLESPSKFSKFHFVCLAIAIRLILAADHGFLFNNSIFLPFTTISGLKLWYVYSNLGTPTSMIYTALVLNGLKPSVASFILKLCKICHCFFLDFCIYFVAFVSVHLTIEYFYQS